MHIVNVIVTRIIIIGGGNLLNKLFNILKKNTDRGNNIRTVLINTVLSNPESVCEDDILKFIGMIGVLKDSYWLLNHDEHKDISNRLDVMNLKTLVLHAYDDSNITYIATTKENIDTLKQIYSKHFNIIRVLNDNEILDVLDIFDKKVC